MSAPDYPFANPPAPGATLEVAPGVHWLRMALPFQLDHINLWLLEDGDDWLIIDSGLGNEPTRALWERIFTGKLGSKPVPRVLVTHYHPDHAGNAAWLCKRFGAALWMTRGEFLTVHAARNSSAGYTTEAQLELFRANGLDDASGAELYAACAASPRTAAGVLEILFRRKLDTSQIFFAMGEAIAHLHYLQYDGQLARTVGSDGVARFAPG